MAWIGAIFELVRKVDRVLADEASSRKVLDSLRERVSKLENERALLMVEAKTAAALAASVMAGHHIADLARRVGVLEERSRGPSKPSSRRRLTDD